MSRLVSVRLSQVTGLQHFGKCYSANRFVRSHATGTTRVLPWNSEVDAIGEINGNASGTAQQLVGEASTR